MIFKRCVMISVLMFWGFNMSAKNFYISSSEGDDSNNGSSSTSAWRTLEKLIAVDLNPGDHILLCSGDVFKGSIFIKTQGTVDNPIVISKYGEGKNPLIDGDGAETAIFLKNPSYITIENLEIKNWKGIYGIRFEAENTGEMNNVVFQNLDIHDVGSHMFEITEPAKTNGAISGRVWKGNEPSWWNGIYFGNIFIHNVGSCGITFGNEVNLYKLQKDDAYYKTHKNVLIENCRIDSTARDGIWIRQCEGAIVQNCVVSHTGLNAVSNGIWFWDCLNSVMQYNEGYECLSPRGNDGAPFSIDNHCWDCTIQFNYSHDNEGPGYMIFGRMGDNGGNVVRNNLSYNDNVTRTYKSGTACITACSQVKDALIENNIIIAGSETHFMLGHRDWEGFPLSLIYRNNLFVGNGKAVVAEPEAVLSAGIFENNMFINIPDLPKELRGNSKSNYFQNLLKRTELIIDNAGNRQN